MKKLVLFTVLFMFLFSLFFIGCKKNPPVENKKPPTCSSNAAPVNNTNVSTTSVTLSWTAATGATSYDVFVGGSAASATKVGNVTTTSYNYTIPSNANATYYWYVVPKNADGSATGCSSSATSFVFGTAPGCARNIEPANGTSLTTKTITLKWSKVANSSGYDVYLGTTSTPTATIATNVTDTVFTYTVPANYTTTYYWYVVPKNTGGAGTGCTSSVTAFTYLTAPTNATNISPANGEPVTGTIANLKWSKVNGASSYDVYAGETAATAISVGSNVTDTVFAYTLPSAELSKTIYWYVVPKNNLGSATNSQATATSFVKLVIKAPATINFPVIGYFPSYRSVSEYPDATFKMTDIVAYAFASLTSTSTVSIASPTVFTAVIAKAKANGAKVLLAINGTQANFAAMGQSAAGRTTLVKDLMTKVRQYDIDGIDLDYEYPRTTDGTDTMFALLARQLSDSLHVDGKYYLSAAITAGKYAGSIRDGIKTEVFNYIDFFNVMVYDDFSTTSGEDYRQHSPYAMAVTCMNYWINTRGMPKSKCILGIPAYGRNSGAAQISTSYKTILTSGTQLGPSPLNLSDSAIITKADNTTFKTYYNGITTVKQKTDYAKQVAGGVMFWEIGHDAVGDNSLIKAAFDQLGRSL